MRILTVSERQKVMTEALKWLGVPYKLRGADKSGVDCSRFVMAVYQNALGISLIKNQDKPFLCSWLFLALKVIPLKDLEIGDLVFYCREPRPISRAVTSVAIYIGANRVVHAGIKNRKVAIELINNYPGLLVNYKDPEIINRWLEEFDREFPIPTG